MLSKDHSIHVTNEVFNTISAIFGAVMALIGSLMLIYASITLHKSWHILSFTIYGAALVNLFVTSALHHGVDEPEELVRLFHQLDYIAIFLLIAGTFTPFCLILLRDTAVGNLVLALVWLFGIIGIVLKVRYPLLPKWISTSLYIGIGWFGILIANPLYQQNPQLLMALIVGGLFFTVGAVIFFFEKPNLIPGHFGFHEIWHIFVLAGAASHFYAMYYLVLPVG